MGLNARVAVLLMLVVASASTVHLAQARFADAAGFSGRAGATCIACHVPAPDPLTGLEPEAHAGLEGLPEAWDVGQTYVLTLRVTGGPPAMPDPQPQGGFDLAVGGGVLAVPEGSESLLRLVGEQEATYRPAGTLQREWSVLWTAPDLAAEPAPVPVWLAVLAANGNHVVASNLSDGGERFDASDHLQVSVPPSAAALAAWRALPLLGPEATVAASNAGVTVEGRHRDGNATRLLWSLDGQPWQARETAPAWRLELPTEPGEHVLLLRSEGAGRTSPDAELRFGEPGLLDGLAGDRATPLPLLTPLVAILAALLSRRSTP